MPSPKERAFRKHSIDGSDTEEENAKEVPQTFERRRISQPIRETGDSEPPARESFLHLGEFECTSCPRPTYLLHKKTLEKVSERVGVPGHPFPPNCHSPYLSGCATTVLGPSSVQADPAHSDLQDSSVDRLNGCLNV